MRSTGNPLCWDPPNNGACFRSTSQCMMYISSGGIGDICVQNQATINQTSGYTIYNCQYVYKPPTPLPTTSTTAPPEDISMEQNDDVYTVEMLK